MHAGKRDCAITDSIVAQPFTSEPIKMVELKERIGLRLEDEFYAGDRLALKTSHACKITRASERRCNQVEMVVNDRNVYTTATRTILSYELDAMCVADISIGHLADTISFLVRSQDCGRSFLFSAVRSSLSIAFAPL